MLLSRDTYYVARSSPEKERVRNVEVMDYTRESHRNESSQETADSRDSCNASKDDCCWTLSKSCIARL